ncbi:MAG: methionyl-tRNA formyltransferase [Clostridium sp.]|nr:methionyl-tRNA formyltransferase [Clostridium sp.]MCM1547292.1 methionyl-tRNA formyltransferase [Ruminococcus sp.]
MKIVFMGTPDFAVPCLKALCESEHEVQAVVTQPDKPKGRGYKMIPTPVKACALEYDIPVYQPLSLKKGEDAENALNMLKELSPELIIVVAYGQILPQSVLELPKHGCINIHASLLPEYRGAAPIQWCVLDGKTETGVTSMQMEAGLDTGDMLIKKSLSIGENETASELHDRLSKLGAEVLTETVSAVENGTLKPEKQDDSRSCYAKMITKEMSRLNFNESAQTVHNIIRGITGFTMLDGKRLKIYQSVIEGESADKAGSVVDPDNFTVVCGDGKCVRFTQVQYEGGKRMNTEDFLRGRKLSKDMVLG